MPLPDRGASPNEVTMPLHFATLPNEVFSILEKEIPQSKKMTKQELDAFIGKAFSECEKFQEMYRFYSRAAVDEKKLNKLVEGIGELIRNRVTELLDAQRVEVQIDGKFIPCADLRIGQYLELRNQLTWQASRALGDEEKKHARVLYESLLQTTAGQVSTKSGLNKELFAQDLDTLKAKYPWIKGRPPEQFTAKNQAIVSKFGEEIKVANELAKRVEASPGSLSEELKPIEQRVLEGFKKKIEQLIDGGDLLLLTLGIDEVGELLTFIIKILDRSQKNKETTIDGGEEGIDSLIEKWRRAVKAPGGIDYITFISAILKNPGSVNPEDVNVLDDLKRKLREQLNRELGDLPNQRGYRRRENSGETQRISDHLSAWMEKAEEAKRLISATAIAPSRVRSAFSPPETLGGGSVEEELLKVLGKFGKALRPLRPKAIEVAEDYDRFFALLEQLPPERKKLFEVFAAAQDLSITADINQDKLNVDQQKVWTHGKDILGSKNIKELLDNDAIDKMYDFMESVMMGVVGSSKKFRIPIEPQAANFAYGKLDKITKDEFFAYTKQYLADKGIIRDPALFGLAWTWFIVGGYSDKAYAYAMGSKSFDSLGHTSVDDGKLLACINPLRMVAYKICAYVETPKDDLAALWLVMFTENSIRALKLDPNKEKKLMERRKLAIQYLRGKGMETDGYIGFIDLDTYDDLLPVFGEAARKGIVADDLYDKVYKGFANILFKLVENRKQLVSAEQTKRNVSEFIKDGLGLVKLMNLGQHGEGQKLLTSLTGMTKLYLMQELHVTDSNGLHEPAKDIAKQLIGNPTINPLNVVGATYQTATTLSEEHQIFHGLLAKMRENFQSEDAGKFRNLPGREVRVNGGLIVQGKLFEEIGRWLNGHANDLEFNRYHKRTDFRTEREIYMTEWSRAFSGRTFNIWQNFTRGDSPLQFALSMKSLPPPCPYDNISTDTKETKK